MVGSQSRTVLSLDADASIFPSSEKAIAVTALLWPSRVCNTALPLNIRQMLHPPKRLVLKLIPDKTSYWCKHQCTKIYLEWDLLYDRKIILGEPFHILDELAELRTVTSLQEQLAVILGEAKICRLTNAMDTKEFIARMPSLIFRIQLRASSQCSRCVCRNWWT